MIVFKKGNSRFHKVWKNVVIGINVHHQFRIRKIKSIVSCYRQSGMLLLNNSESAVSRNGFLSEIERIVCGFVINDNAFQVIKVLFPDRFNAVNNPRFHIVYRNNDSHLVHSTISSTVPNICWRNSKYKKN